MTKKKNIHLFKGGKRPRTSLVWVLVFLVGITGWSLYQWYQRTRKATSIGNVAPSILHPPVPEPFLPEWVRNSNPLVREAYAFAFTNQDSLKYIPCYCGCDRAGHMSARDCFIESDDGSGRTMASHHAEYCNTCLSIALDTKAQLAQGHSLAAIRRSIDASYGQFGHPTPTTWPPE